MVLPGPILVFEAGGSTLRAGRFEPHPTPAIRDVRERPTPSGGPAEVLKALLALGQLVLGAAVPTRVGLAWPGPIDAEGVALASPTVAATLEAFPVASTLEAMYPGVAIHVTNDLSAAGYRQVHEGKLDFCILTVGSGIGHKVFLGGEPILGPGFKGGELGHLRVDLRADAIPCSCGGSGHMGGIASGWATVAGIKTEATANRAAFEASRLWTATDGSSDRIDGPSVADAFAAKDPWVTQLIRARARFLGVGLASVHLGVGVEDFIIVGGFAHALGEDYRLILVEAADAAAWRIGQDWDRMVRLGEHDDAHGMIGAGLLAVGLVGSAAKPE